VSGGQSFGGSSAWNAMLDYLDQRNQDPQPFVWAANADLILGKIVRLSRLFPIGS
jgi:hypothetical protein